MHLFPVTTLYALRKHFPVITFSLRDNAFKHKYGKAILFGLCSQFQCNDFFKVVYAVHFYINVFNFWYQLHARY
jgi:hypothetical protein